MRLIFCRTVLFNFILIVGCGIMYSQQIDRSTTKERLLKEYLPSHLIEFARDFDIPQNFLKEHADLVILILESKSLKDAKEKQNWFDLYILMNDDQIEKLRDILVREKEKLAEIELKYQKREEEITQIYVDNSSEIVYKNILKESILGIDSVNLKIGLWHQKSDTSIWIQGREIKCFKQSDALVTINPNDGIEYYINKFPALNQYELRAKYEQYLSDYKNYFLFKITNEELSCTENMSYHKSVWSNIIDIVEKNISNEVYDLVKIASLKLDESDKAIVSKRLWALYSAYSMLMDYNNQCETLLEIHNEQLAEYKAPQRYLMRLYTMTLFQSVECEECYAALRDQLILLYSQERDYILDHIKNFINFQTHFLLIDYLENYLSDNELINIVTDLKEIILEHGIMSNINIYSEDKRNWYYNLNQIYYNDNFSSQKNLSELNNDFLNLAQNAGINISIPTEYEPARMEYLCYYALYQICNNPQYNSSEINLILDEVLRIGNIAQLSSYRYIEKDIANIIYLPATVDLLPPVLNIVNMPEQTKDSILTILGTIIDNSEVVYLKINNNNISFHNGIFNTRINLTAGINKLLFESEDKYGNKLTEEYVIDYVPERDPFLTRKDYALIITFDQYKESSVWAPLNNSKKDGEDIGKRLEEVFGFEVEHRHNLTKRDFNRFIRDFFNQPFGKYDQTLIYISGHGYLDEYYCKGYLVMNDSEDYKRVDDTYDTYVSYADLTSNLNNTKCEHILLIVDACHSGTIDYNPSFITRNAQWDNVESLFQRSFNGRSRFFLTSGGSESVSDGHPGYNSPFAIEVLTALDFSRAKNGVLTLMDINTIVGRQELRPRFDDVNENCPGKAPGAHWGVFGNNNISGADFVFTVRQKTIDSNDN